MDVAVPNRAITLAICAAIRSGRSFDQACVDAGIRKPTLLRWMEIGRATAHQGIPDPHAAFFMAFKEALQEAHGAEDDHEDDEDLDDFGDDAFDSDLCKPEPDDPPREPRESDRADTDSPSTCPSLVWMVVEEAPIEIVIGSRPPWVYETHPSRRSTDAVSGPTSEGRAPATIPSDRPEQRIPPDEPTPITDRAHASRPDPSLAAIIMVLIANTIATLLLLALIVVVVALIPVALAGLILIGVIRWLIRLAFRWRAGLIALRGGGADVGPFPVGWAARWTSPSSPTSPQGFRRLGAIASTGRTLPKRE